MATVADRIHGVVAPVLGDLGLDLFDLEHTGDAIRVVVERAGGATHAERAIDLDELTAATRAVSRALDDADPVAGHYTLEVSTPGLERRLRTPAHFTHAIGETVSVKLLPGGPDEERRARGVLVAADDTTATLRLEGGEERTIDLDRIDRATTVFEWGPGPKPGKSGTPRTEKRARS